MLCSNTITFYWIICVILWFSIEFWNCSERVVFFGFFFLLLFLLYPILSYCAVRPSNLFFYFHPPPPSSKHFCHDVNETTRKWRDWLNNGINHSVYTFSHSSSTYTYRLLVIQFTSISCNVIHTMIVMFWFFPLTRKRHSTIPLKHNILRTKGRGESIFRIWIYDWLHLF